MGHQSFKRGGVRGERVALQGNPARDRLAFHLEGEGEKYPPGIRTTWSAGWRETLREKCFVKD